MPRDAERSRRNKVAMPNCTIFKAIVFESAFRNLQLLRRPDFTASIRAFAAVDLESNE